MPLSNHRMLYLCADRGIPLGGTKGGSVHIRQFLDHLQDIDWSATVLVARVEQAHPHAGPRAESVHTIAEIRSHRFTENVALDQEFSAQAKEAALFLKNEPMAEALERIYNDTPYELIYERYSLFSMAGRAFANKYELPFVLEVNSPLLLEAAKYRSLIQTDLARAIEKYLFRTSDHIVAVSKSVRDYILSVTPEASVTVIPNGFDHKRFITQIVKKTDRILLPMFTSEDLVVGFLGAVKPWHGVEGLLGLFEEFQADHEPLKLALVGDSKHLAGYFKEDAESLIKNGSVAAIGPVSFESVPQYLSEIDILVAPYPELNDFYFSPLKVYEYMASGRPIIASAIGQIKDILKHDVTALLIKPGDTAELRQAILRLKDDSSLRERLGRAARAEAFAKHTWQNRLGQLDAIIQPLIINNSQLREADHAR